MCSRKAPSMMDTQQYYILLRGRIDPGEIGTASPLDMKIERMDTQNTKLEVLTDQSGIIGQLRYLHGRGLVILSVYCEEI